MVSKYSKYYGQDKTDPGRLVCRTCNASLKKAPRNATSGLKRHLFHQHIELYHELTRNDELTRGESFPEESSSSLAMNEDAFFMPFNLDSICSQSVAESEELSPLHKAVLRCIVEENLPLSFVDSPSVQDLLNLASNGQYNLPASKYFASSEVPECYEKQKSVICAAIQNAISEGRYISLSADQYLYNGSQHLLGITAHWVTNQFEVKKAILGIAMSDGVPTSAICKELFERCLHDFEIPENKVQCFVSSGQFFECKVEEMPCLARTIEISVKHMLDSIESWTQIYTSVRKICEFIQTPGSLAQEDYLLCLTLANLPSTQLANNSAKSWPEIYQICERFLDAKGAVEHLCSKYPNLPILNVTDWYKIATAKKLLKPIYVAAKLVHFAPGAPLSVVFPFVRVLLTQLEMSKKDEVVNIQQLFGSVAMQLSRYLENETNQLASMFDPRFKMNFILPKHTAFFQTAFGKLAHEWIEKETEKGKDFMMVGQIKAETEDNSEVLSVIASASGLQTSSNLGLNVKESSREEVQSYLAEASDMNANPMVYWRERSITKFGTLSNLAMRFLSTPAIAYCEELETCVQMALIGKETPPEILQRLLFLKANSSIFPISYNCDFNIS